jgi:D-tyrosyl-tRNA(Tyr) deacylase|tara:strand:+ start:803 stop:1249 length:447 start_codon:yes stop_codon:yes gene_type:complete
MIALLQTVKEASVSVNSKIIGKIGEGLLIFIGVFKSDTWDEAKFLANKCANIRIFTDNQGKMNKSLLEVSGSCLIVSQFTLCANSDKGRRPSFVRAANHQKGIIIYNDFIKQFQENNIKVATGIFGEKMNVHSINDGPVTLILNSDTK